MRDAGAVIGLFEQAARALHSSTLRARSVVRIPSHGRLLATGDLHDNPAHLQKIITLAKLDKSPDHHVVLHEMIHGDKLVNGLDLSHRMLAKVAELVLQFPEQVHPILANHELAQMTGKGVSKGAGNSVEMFNDGLEFVFGDDAFDVAVAIGVFIRAMPLALMSTSYGKKAGAGSVLCAHSLPSARMMNQFDTDIFERDLQPEDYAAPNGSAHLMVWGRSHTTEQIEQLARLWNVSLFCLGHEHVDDGILIKPPRMVILNSDHERGKVLPLNLADLPEAATALLHVVPLSSLA
jgi:hypothetical protein